MELPHDRRSDAFHSGAEGPGVAPHSLHQSPVGQSRKGAGAQSGGKEAGSSCEKGRKGGGSHFGETCGEETGGQVSQGEIVLPHLRFSKDKRGYENTYVVHAVRRKGKARSRILYWFRTPPGVRVGRAALDEDAVRIIEANNPDLQFDWTRILKGHQDPDDRHDPIESAKHERKERQDRRRPDASAHREPARVKGVPPGRDTTAGSAAADALHEEGAVGAARARLGAEGLARLRGRYSEMLARISERIADPDQQKELKLLAERLNPDAWVTDIDVSEGLEAYEAAFDTLRGALAPHRVRTGPPPASDTSVAEPSDRPETPGQSESDE